MPSLSTNPRDADAAIKGSRFASLGDALFYHGSVNTGDGDTAPDDLRQGWTARATTFASSGVRRRRFSGGAFVILSAIYGLVQHTHHSLQ